MLVRSVAPDSCIAAQQKRPNQPSNWSGRSGPRESDVDSGAASPVGARHLRPTNEHPPRGRASSGASRLRRASGSGDAADAPQSGPLRPRPSLRDRQVPSMERPGPLRMQDEDIHKHRGVQHPGRGNGQQRGALGATQEGVIGAEHGGLIEAGHLCRSDLPFAFERKPTGGGVWWRGHRQDTRNLGRTLHLANQFCHDS
jgi:hypothetical protein